MQEPGTARVNTEAPKSSPEPTPKAAEAVDHLKAALDKLRHNVSTYVLFCFLLAWCLTGDPSMCQHCCLRPPHILHIYSDAWTKTR